MRKSFLAFSLLLFSTLLEAHSAGFLKAVPHEWAFSEKKPAALGSKAKRLRNHVPLPAKATVDVKHYRLEGFFNWTTRRLVATLHLDFMRLNAKDPVVVLDSAVTEVKHVLYRGRAVPFTQQDFQLSMTLPAFEGRSTETLQIVYETTGSLPDLDFRAIQTVTPRKGDPIQGYVAYTTSEPLGAALWMPCHNVPSDRAHFSVSLTVPREQDVIANGHRIKDEKLFAQGLRRITYSTAYTLPTYLMAFALGDLETRTSYLGKLPVSMVFRRGLSIDSSLWLNRVREMIHRFESLVGAYPFEKYMVVLLPEFPSGGVEHAGITFQEETRSTQPDLIEDLFLTAHELGHQWFGDLMTVTDWDDLWIKEGMATLISSEAMRPWLDLKSRGRLMGEVFATTKGDAIYDPSLAPDDKYTSGPYGRSAWLLTQLRSIWGDAKFWGFWRELLKAHAFSSISTQDFLEALAKKENPAFAERFKKALQARAVPELEAKVLDRGKVELKISDPDQSMIVPLTYRLQSVSNDQAQVTEGTVSDAGVTLDLKPGWLLSFDTQDIHPFLANLEDDRFVESLASALIPKGELWPLYLNEWGAHQQNLVLSVSEGWDLTPQSLDAFLNGLTSQSGKYLGLKLACTIASKASDQKGWKEALERWMHKLGSLGLPGRTQDEGLSHCTQVLGPGFVNDWWNRWVKTHPNATAKTVEKGVLGLSLLAENPTTAWARWRPTVQNGSSVRLRQMAARFLVKHLEGVGRFLPPSNADKAVWMKQLRQWVVDSQVSDVTDYVFLGLEAGKDLEALPVLATYVDNAESLTRIRALCTAYGIAKEGAGEWEKFLTAVHPDAWPAYLKSVLEKPEEHCGKH